MPVGKRRAYHSRVEMKWESPVRFKYLFPRYLERFAICWDAELFTYIRASDKVGL